MDTDKILVKIEGQVAWLTFNAPEKRNAICLEMWQGIGDALESFENNSDIRVVVLQGAGGKSFAAGADISEFDRHRGNAQQKKEYGKISQRANYWLKNLSKPLIAKIDGYCIGGGLAIALDADIRFASSHSSFAIPAGRLGLGYEYEGLAKLAHIVGPSCARDILFSARRLDAQEALKIGLVNFVTDSLESDLSDYLERIVANAPLTIKAAKLAVNYFENPNTENTNYNELKDAVNACFDSEDYREGRRAFSEKRLPKFVGN